MYLSLLRKNIPEHALLLPSPAQRVELTQGGEPQVRTNTSTPFWPFSDYLIPLFLWLRTTDSEYANVHFRSAILQTIVNLDSLARKFLPELPPLRPHRPMIEHLKPLSFVLLQDDSCRLKDYDELVEQARYDDEEPSEDDWRRCEELVEQMKSM